MSLWDAIAAGLLQGLLEWLPVSSSGQVSLYYSLLVGVSPIVAYKLGMASHLGTALSGVIVLRRELASALRGGPWFRVVVVPTLAALPVGWLVSQSVEDVNGDVLNALIGLMLLATAGLLSLSTRGSRRVGDLEPHHLVAVGLLEGLAAVPGLSRSGVTMAALLYMGLNPVDAVRASLVMGVPVTMAAGLYYMVESAGNIVDPVYAIAMGLSSMIAGLLSAYFMLAVANRLRDRIRMFLAVMGLLILAYYTPALIG